MCLIVGDFYAVHVGTVSPYNNRNMFMNTFKMILMLDFYMVRFCIFSFFPYFDWFDSIVWFTDRISSICYSCVTFML